MANAIIMEFIGASLQSTESAGAVTARYSPYNKWTAARLRFISHGDPND